MLPAFVTFTGLDDQTDLVEAFFLSTKYPIEWGVLFGGRLGANRYPSQQTVDTIVSISKSLDDVKISAHLCGKFARDAVNGVYPDNLSSFTRTQINAVSYDLGALKRIHDDVKIPVIMQHRNGAFPILPEGVYALHDQSGGKGVVPTSRPLSGDHLVGYAGGIGPENVSEIISDLSGNFWIDMETKIRTNDWLDLAKCESVCKQIWG